MNDAVDATADALSDRLDALPDVREGEHVSGYVCYAQTVWTDEHGQRRTDVRRFVAPGMDPHHAFGIATAATSRLERDLDPRHHPVPPAPVVRDAPMARAS